MACFPLALHQNAAPIAEKLDPYAAYMPYRLYRDATRFEPLATAEHGPNAVIKDLAYLNRPLNTVVMLDTDKTHVSKNKSNAIIVPKWDGTGNDKGLVELIPFLECQSSSFRLRSQSPLLFESETDLHPSRPAFLSP